MSIALFATLILATAPKAEAFLPAAFDANVAPFAVSQSSSGASDSGASEDAVPEPPLVQAVPVQSDVVANQQTALATAPSAATPLPGFHFENKHRTDWIFGGLGAFAFWYLGTEYVVRGAQDLSPVVHIPVVGAAYLGGWFISAALQLGSAAANGSCGYLGAICGITAPLAFIAGIGMFVDAAAQATGLVFSLAGLFTTKQVEVADAPTAKLLPFAVPGGGGLGVSGHF